jgi:hypothetical protein
LVIIVSRPFSASCFSAGAIKTPVSFGMKAKVGLASRGCAVQIALGMEI